MATNYPGSLDTSTQQPSPSASTEMDDSGFEHDAVHTNHSGAIIALETKVGTGDSTAVANSVLAGTGSGTSGWTTTPTVVDLTATGNVDITGTLAVDGIVTLGDEIKGGSGSAADPVFTFASDGDTGMYSAGTNALGFTTGGTSRLVIQSDGDLEATGNITLDGDLTGTSNTNFFVKNDSGEEILFQESSNALYFKTNGTYRGYFTSGGDFVPYADSSYDLGSTSLRWSQLHVDYVRAANGSAGAPALSFSNDSNTGFYITGNSGVIYWSGNNNSGGYLFNGGIRTDNGSAATPSHSFTGDADTGMYRNTTNQVSLTAGGTQSLIAAAGTVNTAGLSTSTTSGYQYVLRNTTFGTLYRYTSSTDVKENITNVTASDAGAWMDALQPVTFNERWLQDGTESDEDRAFREADIQVGFVADDVLANSTTAKFAQVENVDGTLKGVGWKWECVIAAAVAEIKSLRTRVADLEAA